MAREDAIVVEEFKKVIVSHMKDVLIALPAIIPQTKEDEIIFKRGMKAISDMVYDLEHADTVREVGQYLDVQKIVKDFDAESVKNLNQKISSSARASIAKLNDMIDSINGGD